MSSRVSLRKPIDQMCRWCNYDETDQGNWREQVENCSSQDCPLFTVRPRVQKTSVKAVFSDYQSRTGRLVLATIKVSEKRALKPPFLSKERIPERGSRV